MKLPIILGAMIAALATPATLAEDASTEEKTEAAEATPEAEKAAPEAEKAAPATKKPAGKKAGKHHARKGGAHHHKKHRHHHDNDSNPPSDPYKGSYDDGRLQKADGYPSEDYSPKAGQMEVPGQKTP